MILLKELITYDIYLLKMSRFYEDKEFTLYVVELMSVIGPVLSKRMFGGSGIFLDDLMFGLVADGTLYLKADNENKHEFISLGLEPFTYFKQKKEIKMSYYQAPEEALENSDDMSYWAKLAFGAALRSLI